MAYYVVHHPVIVKHPHQTRGTTRYLRPSEALAVSACFHLVSVIRFGCFLDYQIELMGATTLYQKSVLSVDTPFRYATRRVALHLRM